MPGIVLTESLGFRRDHVAPAADRPHGYDAGYDFLTLAYDAFYRREAGAVWMVCPRLTNFRALIDRAAFDLDGAPVSVRRVRRFGRFDVVELPAPGPGRLGVAIDGFHAALDAPEPDRGTFAGRNTLVTVSRNNELDWIQDWVRFHARIHGADALLLYDNGSDLYEAEAIGAALADDPALRAVRIISADFPYGPLGRGRSKFDGNFLQAALLNIARLKHLPTARAALQCDVDELVVPRAGRTVFDAAAASRSGYLKFAGRWVYPDTAAGTVARHRDHVLTGAPPRTCPPKYCVVPGGPLRDHTWATHRIRGLLLGWRYLSRDFGFLHCRGISDFWKGRPRPLAEGAGRRDPEAEAILVRAFD